MKLLRRLPGEGPKRSRSALLQAAGEFEPAAWETLRAEPALIEQAAAKLAERFWQPERHSELLRRVGLSEPR